MIQHKKKKLFLHLVATETAWRWGHSPGYWRPSSLQVSITAFSVSLVTLILFSCLHVALWLSCRRLHTSLYLLTWYRESYGDMKRHLLGGKKFIFLFFSFGIVVNCVFFVFTWSVYISIETAKQKMEMDIQHQKAELKVLSKQMKITELQKEFQQLLNLNESLPEHLHLTHEVHVHCHKSNTWKVLIGMHSSLWVLVSVPLKSHLSNVTQEDTPAVDD